MSNPDYLLLECPDYESYLDKFVRSADRYYLRNDIASRTLVQLGYRSTALYTPKKFEQMKQEMLESLLPRKKINVLFSYGMKFTDPVIKELAERELPNVQKVISTIIFVRYRNPNGFDITGFIDYEHSLHQANLGNKDYPDWSGVFMGRLKLRPRKHDLSYFNWHRGTVFHNNSDNYIVNHDKDHGLLFIHRGDHKKICINSSSSLFCKNSDYLMFQSKKLGDVIFFDHVIHKKI